MGRLLLIFSITGLAVLTILGVWYAKDSYKLLPLAESAKVASMDPYSTWQEYKVNDKFRVMFPLPPQNASQTVQDKTYDMYVSQSNNGGTFGVTLVSSKKAYSNFEEASEEFIKSFVDSNPANRLINESPSTLDNERALAFEMMNQENHLRGKIAIKGSVVYVLMLVTTDPELHEEDFEFFLNSFKFL